MFGISGFSDLSRGLLHSGSGFRGFRCSRRSVEFLQQELKCSPHTVATAAAATDTMTLDQHSGIRSHLTFLTTPQYHTMQYHARLTTNLSLHTNGLNAHAMQSCV